MPIKGPKPLAPPHLRFVDEAEQSIFQQERMLRNNPFIHIHRYAFTAGAGSPPAIIKTETLLKSSVPAAIADFEEEQIANSGGLILPTDRLVTLYDYAPGFYDVIEYPAGSGNMFSIAKKDFNPRSARCDIQIRSQNLLHGAVFRQTVGEVYDPPTATIVKTFRDIVLPVMIDAVRANVHMAFYGRAQVEDSSFFVLKENLKYSGNYVVPTTADLFVDDSGDQWTINGVEFDALNKFYTLICHKVGA